jgi:hypothetical protein
MKDLMLGMTYFLAGSFIINTVKPSLSIDGFVWFVGIVLAVAGLIYVLISILMSLPWNPIRNPIQQFKTKYEPNYGKYLYAILFAVVASEIVVIVWGFRDNVLLLAMGGFFLLLLLVLIIINSVPALFRDVRSLLTATISFVGIAIYILFTENGIMGNGKVQLAVVLILCLATLFAALHRVTKRNNPQTPVGRAGGKRKQMRR